MSIEKTVLINVSFLFLYRLKEPNDGKDVGAMRFVKSTDVLLSGRVLTRALFHVLSVTTEHYLNCGKRASNKNKKKEDSIKGSKWMRKDVFN